MSALEDIATERRRQIECEGWSPEHDDAHDDGSLALVASCYADRSALASRCVSHGFYATNEIDAQVREPVPANWPWSATWWKFGDRRRALVKAGALIVAEIERLDRASAKSKRYVAAPVVKRSVSA